MRAWCSGNIRAFQAFVAGSNPAARLLLREYSVNGVERRSTLVFQTISLGSNPNTLTILAGIAQRVERLLAMQKAVGSNPITRSNKIRRYSD